MQKPETDHEHFGELSALAILGQVSAEEHHELRAHLQSCAACRRQHEALSRILLADLPLARDEKDSGVEPVGVARFDPLSESSEASSDWRAKFRGKQARVIYARAAIFLLFVTAGGLGIRVVRESQLNRLQAEQVASLHEKISGLSDQVRNLEKHGSEPVPSVATAPTTAQAVEIRNAESDRARLLARNRELDAQLKTATAELANLKHEASLETNHTSELSARLDIAQETLEKLTAELKSVRESQAQDAVVIAKQESQLVEVEEKLTAARSSMERDKKLLVADRDIRDLMGARNLRIIDVFDVDSKGKTRKPFGRVFFTEGKSLIFYAFDLGNNQSATEAAAYQAWGSEGSFEHGVRSLGIFYRDDQKANRWVLKFDDPDVLTEIDSVFVTTEPAGGSKKPTGGRLLAAYVKASLNHP